MNSSLKTRAVIFDMDGVLVDSEPLINAAAIAMFREHGLDVQPDDFLPFVGMGEERYIGGVAEKYNLALDLTAAKQRTYDIYLDLVPSQLSPFPGAVELVSRCRALGLKVAVASSADKIKVQANLQKMGLPVEYWDAVTWGEEVQNKKPAPDIFLITAEKLGVSPSECMVVEDALNGVKAAHAAGMRCIGLATTLPEESLQEADLVRKNIADIQASDLIFPPE